VGGTLLYVSRYVDPVHEDLDRPAAEIERDYLAHARTMLPALRETEVLAASVQRARAVEPVHLLGGAARLPSLTPAPRLVLASTANVYPENVNGQAVLGVSERAVAATLAELERDAVREAA
jgi:hypothetical protein